MLTSSIVQINGCALKSSDYPYPGDVSLGIELDFTPRIWYDFANQSMVLSLHARRNRYASAGIRRDVS